jgi:hypothetical protein
MPLQSSGQIKLSDIRNEYALGSGQIAMSQLRGKGNAAASGQIQMAANFYGTSNITYLADGTLTAGRVLDKASKYFYGRHENTPNSNSNIGSFSLSPNTIGLNRAYQAPINDNIQTTGTQPTTFRVTGDRVDIDTVKLGSTTKRRRYGEIDFLNSGTDKNIRGTYPIMNLNSTYDVEIVKLADDDPFCTMTFTVQYWTTTTGKGETLLHRGFNLSSSTLNSFGNRGSVTSGTNSVRNPENNSQYTTVLSVYGTDSRAQTVGGGFTGKIEVTANTANGLKNRMRFFVISRNNDNKTYVYRVSGLGTSDFEPSANTYRTISTGNSAYLLDESNNVLYNFLNSTSATYTLKIV